MIAALLLFFSAAAPAAPLDWFDLEPGREYALSQDLTLGGALYKAGLRLELASREPLSVPGAPMSYLTLLEYPCRTPEARSDLEIVTPVGAPEAASVGVELSPNCNWGIYVEDKDAFTPSFLESAPGAHAALGVE